MKTTDKQSCETGSHCLYIGQTLDILDLNDPDGLLKKFPATQGVCSSRIVEGQERRTSQGDVSVCLKLLAMIKTPR